MRACRIAETRVFLVLLSVFAFQAFESWVQKLVCLL